MTTGIVGDGGRVVAAAVVAAAVDGHGRKRRWMMRKMKRKLQD
jgi:hypothetical protein